MKYNRLGTNYTTEDGKYTIKKNHVIGCYDLYKGTKRLSYRDLGSEHDMAISFPTLKEAKEFVERLYK